MQTGVITEVKKHFALAKADDDGQTVFVGFDSGQHMRGHYDRRRLETVVEFTGSAYLQLRNGDTAKVRRPKVGDRIVFVLKPSDRKYPKAKPWGYTGVLDRLNARPRYRVTQHTTLIGAGQALPGEQTVRWEGRELRALEQMFPRNPDDGRRDQLVSRTDGGLSVVIQFFVWITPTEEQPEGHWAICEDPRQSRPKPKHENSSNDRRPRPTKSKSSRSKASKRHQRPKATV